MSSISVRPVFEKLESAAADHGDGGWRVFDALVMAGRGDDDLAGSGILIVGFLRQCGGQGRECREKRGAERRNAQTRAVFIG